MPDDLHAAWPPLAAAEWPGLMRAGDFAAAWRISDAVLAARDPATRDAPGTPYHERWVWDGTEPDGRRVLVRCYHGLGDTLQFVRFLPALRARAAHVTLECQKELCGLLACLPGVDRLVAFDTANPLPRSPCDIEVMELAHVLRAGADAVAAPVPYLTLPPHRLARGRQRAGGHTALCWRAGDWDPDRSVALPDLLRALGDCGRYVSLQRGAASAEAEPAWFANPFDDDCDVMETAALICGADHVVTVDTMVAHLAGALGCAATVLLKRDPDWRWAATAGRSVWYPSLRLQGSKQGLLF